MTESMNLLTAQITFLVSSETSLLLFLTLQRPVFAFSTRTYTLRISTLLLTAGISSPFRQISQR